MVRCRGLGNGSEPGRHYLQKLDDSQKADLTREKAIGLMLEQPSMIKRPVLEAKEAITVGFKPETYQSLFA